MTLPDWLRTQLTEIRQPASGTAPTEPAKRDPAPGVPANVLQPALDRIDTTIRWLIGALAASAVVMLAGVQLSPIGQLSWPADDQRLLLAGTAITVAILLILTAIGFLSWAQAPVTSSQLQLERTVAEIERVEEERARAARAVHPDYAATHHPPTPRLRKPIRELQEIVAADASMHRNLKSLPNLLAALTRQRNRYYDLVAKTHRAELELARSANHVLQAKARAKVEQLAAELDVTEQRLNEYRLAVFRVAHLDKYLRVRRRFWIAVGVVLVAALGTALSFVVFAWAANPPPRSTLTTHPVAGQLVLLPRGAERYEDLLGAECTNAARRPGGIPIIVLAATRFQVEIIVLPEGACDRATRLKLPEHLGHVTRDGDAIG